MATNLTFASVWDGTNGTTYLNGGSPSSAASSNALGASPGVIAVGIDVDVLGRGNFRQAGHAHDLDRAERRDPRQPGIARGVTQLVHHRHRGAAEGCGARAEAHPAAA